MKIGILTYHRAENYGALLQAYALKSYLQNLGHEVGFVDYWPEYHEDYFRIFSKKRFLEAGLRGKLVQLYYLFFWTFKRKRRKVNLQDFMCKKLGLDCKPKYRMATDICDEFEIVFYGSDQIWRKQGMISFPGFDYWYWGADNVKAKKVAYAASMGNINVTGEDKTKIKSCLKSFDSISVREDDLKVLLDLLSVSSELVVDPVFLLRAEEWVKLISKVRPSNHGYVLIYNLLGNDETVRFADKLAKKNKLKVIEITKKYLPFAVGGRYNYTASVEEFLSLIYHADYVVSNSFHGVAFSIILKKQFYAIGMGEKASRVTSLLKIMGMDNRYIIRDSCVENIDYMQTDVFLHNYIATSKKFINKALGR